MIDIESMSKYLVNIDHTHIGSTDLYDIWLGNNVA